MYLVQICGANDSKYPYQKVSSMPSCVLLVFRNSEGIIHQCIGLPAPLTGRVVMRIVVRGALPTARYKTKWSRLDQPASLYREQPPAPRARGCWCCVRV